MNKASIIIMLVLSITLTGCQKGSSENIKISDNNKEICRDWIESEQSQCQKEIDKWENKLDQCQNQLSEKTIVDKSDNLKIGESFFYDSNKGSGFNIEMERYKNKMYGYTIEIPRSWGAIQPYGGTFTDNLYEEMETIGPYLESDKVWREYFYIEVFNKENTYHTAFEKHETLFDFYEEFRLENKKYTENKFWENQNEIKEFIEYEENGDYLNTHRLMLNENTLYVFSYNENNNIHQGIINSISLNAE